MKFVYKPGIRPIPMLMYYKELNENVFNEEHNAFKNGKFINEWNHIWNIGSYLIYNNNFDILAYRITDVYNFLWLLRTINKKIVIDFTNDFIENNQNFIKEVSGELTIL